MRILFLTQTYPRFEGDTSGPFIRDLARGLVRGGDEVTVLTPHAAGVPGRWRSEGVDAISFRYAPVALERLGYSRSLAADERVRLLPFLVTPLYALAARRAVARQLAAAHFDVVHAHWVVPNGPIAQGAWRRAAFGVGLHGSDVFLAERPVVRWLASRALARSSFLTGCSPELVDRVAALGFPRERAAVIPYGVDVELFSPDRGRRGLWRQRLGIPADAPLMLGVGRMATKKGFQVLVDVLDGLFAAHPGAHLVLAGGGDLLDELRDRAAPHAGRVHFPGPVLRDTLPDLYRAADVFVLPAVHDPQGNVDGLPNVILEALASGLPVVASAISGIPLAVDATDGVLVEEGDREGLLAALVGLLGAPERAAELGAGARRRAVAELTWDAVAARYRAAYERGLAERAGGEGPG